ncbi:MAG: di-heme oxidoredictase family protein [Bryobacteraceae bacterium]
MKILASGLRSWACAFVCFGAVLLAETDPGPRSGTARSGLPINGISTSELNYFNDGRQAFDEIDRVENGLGPRFNLDGCGGCHSHPAVGGTSPAINPQIATAGKEGALNQVPGFLRQDGPIRVVRFRRRPDGTPDGGVHSLFVITGRSDAPPGCKIEQPDFSRIENLSFRIPTPVFGLGLIEAIQDSVIRANLDSNRPQKRLLGINGRVNINANDGTITRFGWKAQNKSLAIFSGEAYNVEIGVTNEMFPQEREENSGCLTRDSPEDHMDAESGKPADTQLFTMFMRYLAAPEPAVATPALNRGRALFDSAGCAFCHAPTLRSGGSGSTALNNRDVSLYSDLALHRMGQGLDDGISQGLAQGQDWRTAPLWGLGDRIFLLHDGRTKDLSEAIRLHDGPGSEAHGVVANYAALPDDQKQDLLNFLRSL